MRYIGDILTEIRERSHNQDFSVGTGTSSIEDVVEGVGNQLLLSFVNEGQTHLQSAIVNQCPTEFVVDSIVSVIGGQEEYSIPDNMFVNNRLVSVQYSQNGQAREYYNLSPRSLRDRYTDVGSHPSWYIRRSGKILLNPIPTSSQGTLRIEYYRELDHLQLRAGTITSVSGTTTLTAINITDDASVLENLINNVGDKYLCICDKDGLVKEYNIPYTSYSAGAFTMASHVRTGTETIVAGDYITVGKYTTTHSDLPFSTERFLVSYGALMALKLDSSSDFKEEAEIMQLQKQDILDSFGDVDEDIHDFPILDHEEMM